ncbi:MAG: carboxy-S-adenosyl-L-methionine synthase CmoA [Halothiobacillaceae bacterium]
MGERDRIFAESAGEPGPFRFDERVAEVFPDMISRSVPGYAFVLETLTRLARRLVQPYSRVYDLGCSLGAATLAMRSGIDQPGVECIAVDNSPAMVERARAHVAAFRSSVPAQLALADLRDVVIENASLVVMNFTLQFLPQDERADILARVHSGLRPGGALVLAEKVHHHQPGMESLIQQVHLDFKRDQGYSELEISQKRQALENVLVTDTLAEHDRRLEEVGFMERAMLCQHYNFAAILARKTS